MGDAEGGGPGRPETGRGILRKSRDVYAVITDFSLQLQRSEKTGTELGTDRRCRCRTPMPWDRRDRSHTKWLDRSTAWEAVIPALAPVPAEPGRGCARASSLRRVPRCLPVSTAPSASLRSATRAPGRRVTQRWHTPALGALALGDERPCLGTCMPGCTGLRLGAPAGAAMAYTRHAGEGCAGRFATGRGAGRPAASRPAPGSGCPLRPRGVR